MTDALTEWHYRCNVRDITDILNDEMPISFKSILENSLITFDCEKQINQVNINIRIFRQ